MKKLFSVLILVVISMMTLVGCGNDKTADNIKSFYVDMVKSFNQDIDGVEENKLFSDESMPLTINIKYHNILLSAINNESATTDIQKRYRGLYYEQLILNSIFNYYENNQQEFYRKTSGKVLTQKEINNLYKKVEILKSTLEEFKPQLELFEDNTSQGVSDDMVFSLMSYTYQLNKVVESSFDFIYCFIDLYEKYCIENPSTLTPVNLIAQIDRSYVDIANVVFLENIKGFNYSVGQKGVCDLSAVVNSSNKFNILNNVIDIKSLSPAVIENMSSDATNYESTMNKVNNYIYAKDVLLQRVTHYRRLYTSEDLYTINQYRYGQVTGVSYEDYLTSLMISERANIRLLEDFVLISFKQFVSHLNLIVE